jgi:hypothetical protein
MDEAGGKHLEGHNSGDTPCVAASATTIVQHQSIAAWAVQLVGDRSEITALARYNRLRTKSDSLQPTADTAVYLFDDWFDPIEAGVRDRAREFIQAMVEGELDAALIRPRYVGAQNRRATIMTVWSRSPVTGVAIGRDYTARVELRRHLFPIGHLDLVRKTWPTYYSLAGIRKTVAPSPWMIHHELGGLRRQHSLCPHGSMTHRREHALDRV